MPKDNIERAIKRGQGADGEDYQEVRYEGYGPGGVAMIVEALTDNRNRTASDVRAAFTQVRRQPRRDEQRQLPVRSRRSDPLPGDPSPTADEMLEAAIEAGAEDCTSAEDSHEITCGPDDLAAVRDSLEARFGPPDQALLGWRPQTTVPVEDDRAATLFKLLETLDDSDDVQRVVANFEVSEAALERLGG